MNLIFFLPLALSVIGSGYFLFQTEADRKWKALALGLTTLSLVLQLMPERVIFVIPLALQCGVAVWMAVYWKLDG